MKSAAFIRIPRPFSRCQADPGPALTKATSRSSPVATWKSPPANLILNDDEVHVWRASLDKAGSALSEFTATLAQDEWERAQRFRFERDRNRFIVGRAILRAILGRYLRLEPGAVAFSYTATGKPELAGLDASLQFNLAHSDALALYAVTLRGSVGIDIERLRSIPDAEQIAASWFSGREQAELSDMPVEGRAKAFLAGWTRKEAYLKACGRGISEELSQVEVSLAPDEPARLRSLGGETRAVAQWSLDDLRPDPGYVAALAVQASRMKLLCWSWDREQR